MLRAVKLGRDLILVLACFLILPWLAFGGVTLFGMGVAAFRGELASVPQHPTTFALGLGAIAACVVGPICLWMAWRDRGRGLIARPWLLATISLLTILPLGMGVMIGGS